MVKHAPMSAQKSKKSRSAYQGGIWSQSRRYFSPATAPSPRSTLSRIWASISR